MSHLVSQEEQDLAVQAMLCEIEEKTRRKLRGNSKEQFIAFRDLFWSCARAVQKCSFKHYKELKKAPTLEKLFIEWYEQADELTRTQVLNDLRTATSFGQNDLHDKFLNRMLITIVCDTKCNELRDLAIDILENRGYTIGCKFYIVDKPYRDQQMIANVVLNPRKKMSKKREERWERAQHILKRFGLI